jgi:prolyl-tRNA synthetase
MGAEGRAAPYRDRRARSGGGTVARRDTGGKQQIPLPRTAVAIDQLLKDVQASLLQAARDEQERRTLRDPSGYDELIAYLREAAGFVVAPWCGSDGCEARVKEDSSATIRCLPLEEEPTESGACVCCGRSAVAAAVWAQAY